MKRRGFDRGWRAAALAAGLFAITLNFLQPLVHAALMRDAGPAGMTLWASMCLPDASSDSQDGSMPAGKLHECCLGLAHAPTVAPPSAHFVAIEPAVVRISPPAEVGFPTPVGIRDGPSQPRAPPYSA